MPGDANGDDKVNFADYLVLEATFRTTGARADFNDDGTVNFADYLILEANFGKMPEPGTLFMLALAGLSLLRKRTA